MACLSLAACNGELTPWSATPAPAATPEQRDQLDHGWSLLRLKADEESAFVHFMDLALAQPDLDEAWEGSYQSALKNPSNLLAIHEALEQRVRSEDASPTQTSLFAATIEDPAEREQALYTLLRAENIPSAWPNCLLAESCLERDNAIAAADLFAKALDDDASLARAWRGLAVARMNSGQAAESVDPWREYLSLRPEDPDALYKLAYTLINDHGRPRAARPFLDRANRLAPENVSILIGLGNVALLDEEPDPKAAEAAFSEALRLAPDDPDVRYNLGILYADHLNNPTLAIEHFTRYLELGGEGEMRIKQWILELRQQLNGTPLENRKS